MIQGVQQWAEYSRRVERQVTAVRVNTPLKCCVSSIRNNIIVLFRMMHLLCAWKYCSVTMRHVILQQQQRTNCKQVASKSAVQVAACSMTQHYYGKFRSSQPSSQLSDPSQALSVPSSMTKTDEHCCEKNFEHWTGGKASCCLLPCSWNKVLQLWHYSFTVQCEWYHDSQVHIQHKTLEIITIPLNHKIQSTRNLAKGIIIWTQRCLHK